MGKGVKGGALEVEVAVGVILCGIIIGRLLISPQQPPGGFCLPLLLVIPVFNSKANCLEAPPQEPRGHAKADQPAAPLNQGGPVALDEASF